MSLVLFSGLTHAEPLSKETHLGAPAERPTHLSDDLVFEPNTAPSENPKLSLTLLEEFGKIPSFSSGFDMSVENLQGPTQHIQGKLSVLRPKYLTYQDNEQEIVSDGSHIWYHYPSLNQVLKQPFETAEKAIPILLLLQTPKQLETRYHVRKTKPTQFELQSRGLPLERVKLNLNPGTHLPSSLEITYNENVTTKIRFLSPKAKPLSPKDFRFTPPKDADVLEE